MYSITIEAFFEQLSGPNIALISKVDLEAVTAACESEDAGCWVIDGERIRNEDDLLEFLYINLRFPDYFGFNWDALTDVFRDILFDYGAIKTNVCLVITSPKPFIESELNSFYTFVDIINNRSEEQKDRWIKLIIEIDTEEFESGLIAAREVLRGSEISYSILE